MTVTDHWGRNTVKFLAPVLADAQKIIRIASGFFTVQGYDLIREHFIGKRVLLMVGYDEASRERVSQKLIQDIMFHLSTWDGPNRRAAVVALVDQLRKRQLRVVEKRTFAFLDARLRSGDHSKILIVDDSCAFVGSANLTVNGLRNNIEGMTLVRELNQVNYWVQQFQEYWKHQDTVDLTQELLDALLAWLELHTPYDVYLKTIEALIGDDDTEPPRDSYKMPVRFQMVVIERVLRQLKDWGGAMLVASTGLGKTIMATHIAYRLHAAREIFNVLVFAPVQVQPQWEAAMASAGIHCEVLTRDLLDQPSSKRTKAVRAMDSYLRDADEKYLILVDESHHFKNMLRARDGDKRHSFRRLSKAVSEKKAKIILLTATPYAKDVQDLNNQLHLLPHTADPTYVTKSGQYVFPGMRDDEIHPNAWKVQDTPDFFQEFINLPVCTVISTSQVAKDFAERTADGDYVTFGDETRWIPRIEIKKVRVPAPLEIKMSHAIRSGYFRHELKRFQNRGVWQFSETSIEKEAEVAWLSSPAALQEVVEKTLDGTYDEKWIRSRNKQEAVLAPILEELEGMDYRRDTKFMTLCKYVAEAQEKDRKTVIFTERHATAVYLETGLKEQLPEISVASVSRRVEGGYELKDFDNEVMKLIAGFAPLANPEAAEKWGEVKEYDVLVTTDAYSTGVNLQDASVVISYDLAWTPDTIIQRAGRVLRFWYEPRLVTLYVFVGDFQEDEEGATRTDGVERRLRALALRSEGAQQFSEIPVFPAEDSATYESLADLSNVAIEDLGLADITEIEEFTGVSGYLKHITEFKQNQEYTAQIPDDISSAMTYDDDRHLLYLLLRHKRTYFWMLYDVQRDLVSEVKEDRLLKLIQCTRETPIAENVHPNVIELNAQKARTQWLEQQSDVDPARVERICALYLLPYREAGDLGKVLQGRLFG